MNVINFQKTDDSINGGTNIMTHTGQEITLSGIGCFRHGDRFLEGHIFGFQFLIVIHLQVQLLLLIGSRHMQFEDLNATYHG